MPTYTYPKNYELFQILPDLLQTTDLDDPIFKYFPITNRNAGMVMWDIKDNTTGLQGVRGYNGQPNRINLAGHKRYKMEPGVYGDVAVLDEAHMTDMRMLGTANTPIDIEDLIMGVEKELITKQNSRIRQILWTLLGTGTFSVLNKLGQIEHADSFSMQVFTAGITWATTATATPLANFRAIKLLGRGHSVNFGKKAIAFMNQITFNNLIANVNSADLYGKRTNGLSTITSPDDVNRVLLGEDLPQIQIFDEGYFNDAGTYIPFIADNKVIVVGMRPNDQPVGEYQMTRNIHNPDGQPGAYSFIVDTLSDGNHPVPREISVHLGHNGGPAIFYPSAVVRMNV